MIAGWRRRAQDDSGLTLVELIVSMMIFAVVVAGTLQLSIGLEHSTAENISRQDQVDEGRVATEAMTKNLRTAVIPSQLTNSCTDLCAASFVQGQAYSVQFYANVNNAGNQVGPSRVSYTLSTSGSTAGQLTEKIQVPDTNVAGSSGYVYCDAEASGATPECKARLRTMIIARGVRSDTGVPIFQYYDTDGNILTPRAANNALSADDLAKVFAIEITLTTASVHVTKAGSTTYIQRVTLPNSNAVMRSDKDKDE